MTLPLAVRLARRELRGGLRGFRIFLLCLALGVAAIAGVGMVRAAIEAGLASQGAVLLGGDAQMAFTYRFAAPAERAFMAARSAKMSEIVTLRSMASADGVASADGAASTSGKDAAGGAPPRTALSDVKAVDGAYPLTGHVTLAPEMPLAAALKGADGRPGAVMDPVLMARLGLKPGDGFRLGGVAFRLMAALTGEPDAASGGFSLGPRTIVATSALKGTALLAPGSLFQTEYRLMLPPGARLGALKARALARFGDAGMRWSDRRNAAPGIRSFVRRIGSFLVLVGLAGLAVGGVGISAAVRAYVEGKTATIATLKTLGAGGRLIFATYLIQVGVLAVLGIAAGVVLGAGVPLALAPMMAAALPFPAVFALYPAPLAEAALYGALTTLLFTLWPLMRTQATRAAALYRDDPGPRRPPAAALAVTLVVAAALVGAAARFSGVPTLALWSAGGIAATLAVLMLAAALTRRLARRAAHARGLRGRATLRLALLAVGAPRGETTPVILSLGLGLCVLAAVGQIDGNLRRAMARDLPARAPSYFFIDIQPDQMAEFTARMKAIPGVSRIDTAPMLRGVITRINGTPARDIPGNHWVLRGDRGITFSARPPERTRITAGKWWPPDYKGAPQISFAAQEAQELGLKLGDRMTVNVLGRDITGTITSLREVDYASGGISFVLAMDPAALAGAPHTSIATVYAAPASGAEIVRAVARDWPNITAISVEGVIGRVTKALAAIAAATSGAAAATLVTGFVVLIGAAATGARARVHEAAVLKTLGATRARLLVSFALRAVLLGASAGVVAIAAGGLAGWAVMRFIMEAPFSFLPGPAVAIVAGGVAVTLLAGAAFAWPPLAARPARVLRARE